TTERHRQIKLVGAPADVVHLLALDVHPADEHGFRPFEFLPRGAPEVLVDELHLPIRRQVGRNQQQALRRHEGADAIRQRIGMLECPERGGVAREHAENSSGRPVTFSSHQSSPATRQKTFLHSSDQPRGKIRQQACIAGKAMVGAGKTALHQPGLELRRAAHTEDVADIERV
ncbi:hypothetical protein KXW38_010149, partial [Aspergillus fumigatus]